SPFVLSSSKDDWRSAGVARDSWFDKLTTNGGLSVSEGVSQADAPLQADRAVPEGDLFSKFYPLIKQREDLLASGVEDPFSLVMERVLSPTRAVCNGRDTILLGT